MLVQKKLDAMLGVQSAQNDSSVPETFTLKSFRLNDRTKLRPFSTFISSDQDAAIKLAQSFHIMADRALSAGISKEDALGRVLDHASGVDDNPRGIVQHALKVFITHHDVGGAVRLPSLMRRMKSSEPSAEKNSKYPSIGGQTTSEDENKLNWFREDPLANEHHEHWHVVYPSRGIPNSSGTPQIKDRHGELFFYMHQQMLARYDVERLSIGLDRVAPFYDYREPIEVGYFPGKLVVGDEEFENKGRSENVSWVDLPQGVLGTSPEYPISLHEQKRDALTIAINDKALLTPGGVSIPLVGSGGTNLLGATVEVSLGGVDGTSRNAWNTRYGNHHGFGHVLTAWASDSTDSEDWGVMFHEFAAIRDPFFWQWHKHVDGYNVRFQDELNPNSFEDKPNIKFASSDIHRSNSIDLLVTNFGSNADKLEADVSNILQKSDFKKSISEQPEASGDLEIVDQLKTEIRSGVFELSNGKSYSYDYLWHQAFAYLMRVSNTTDENIDVTFRVFLCPMQNSSSLVAGDQWLNDRALWIEMDKFSREIPAQSNCIITQVDEQSSVIRKPAIRSPQEVKDIVFDPDDAPHNPSDHYCDCGWPYHLLLPKGTKEGMSFALLVIATDGEIDRIRSAGNCGSVSFCGVKDQYPDTRAMGYPFDRPLAKPLVEIVEENQNFALRSFKIKHSEKEVGV